MASELILVGTVHYDLQGSQKLEYILEKASPSILALEFDKKREKMLASAPMMSPEEEGKTLVNMFAEAGLPLNPRQSAAIVECARVMATANCFELRTSRDYVSKKPGSRIEYIDITLYEPEQVQEFSNGYIAMMKASLKEIAKNPELVKPMLEQLDKGADAYLDTIASSFSLIYENAEAMAELYRMMSDPTQVEELKTIMPPEAIQTIQKIYNPARDAAMAGRIRELYTGEGTLVAVMGLAHLHTVGDKVADLKPRVITLADWGTL